MPAHSSRQSTLLGLLAIAPAALFVLLGSSMWWAPGNPAYAAFERAMSDPLFASAFNLVSPIVFLAGLALAIILNALPMVRTPRVKPGVWNAAILAAAALLLVLMLGYAITENWLCIIGRDTTC